METENAMKNTHIDSHESPWTTSRQSTPWREGSTFSMGLMITPSQCGSPNTNPPVYRSTLLQQQEAVILPPGPLPMVYPAAVIAEPSISQRDSAGSPRSQQSTLIRVELELDQDIWEKVRQLDWRQFRIYQSLEHDKVAQLATLSSFLLDLPKQSLAPQVPTGDLDLPQIVDSTSQQTSPSLAPYPMRPKSHADLLLLDNAFTALGFFPDPKLRRLLGLILSSQFYKDDNLEPVLGTKQGDALIEQAGFDQLQTRFPGTAISESASIYLLFADNYKCLLCGRRLKQRQEVLGHVRSHVGHQPYHCGHIRCCHTLPSKFCSEDLLYEHIVQSDSWF